MFDKLVPIVIDLTAAKQQKLNESFLTEYDTISHCMIDFRMDGVKRSIKKNEQLEKTCFDFVVFVLWFCCLCFVL